MLIVCMDYFYVTKERVRRREELAKEMEHRTGEAPSPMENANPGGDAINQARAKTFTLNINNFSVFWSVHFFTERNDLFLLRQQLTFNI